MIDSNVLNLPGLENAILDRSNLNSNLFEVNNSIIDGQSSNGCGCPINPIDPLNPIKTSDIDWASSDIYPYENLIVNNSYESESSFLVESSDGLIPDSKGVNLERTNFNEDDLFIKDQKITDTDFANANVSVSDEEILTQEASILQVQPEPIGIFNPQGQIIGIEQGGIVTLRAEYDFTGNLSRITLPQLNFTASISLNPTTNILNIVDNFGNTYQAVYDPITGNTSQETVNFVSTLPPIPGGDCVGDAINLIVAIGIAIDACGDPGLSNRLCRLAFGGIVGAGIALYNNCLRFIPIP